MKFGTRYESPTSGRLGVDEPVLVPKEISSGSKMAKRETASPWIGLESSLAPGPSGTGLRVTCRTDWSFLAPYQGRKTESGGGSVAVAAADVGDGAGCAGVEDGVGRKEANEVKGEGGKRRKRRSRPRRVRKPVAHGPVPTCTPVSFGPCGELGSAYLPTLNLCQPTITGYPSFLKPVPGSLDDASMPNSRGSHDARWICIKCSFVVKRARGLMRTMMEQSVDFPHCLLLKIDVQQPIFQEERNVG